ncbi:hypothetical protein BDV34DRAFT_225095 [Aspergillus parasiticus]|uniref:Uncharacterized protein n=1 Tax=Aspergillus parasiticus TaxID=5067 RepID=A0A5N6DMH1_ASPPA|nr:hypothetical protein BDV34DRAFT_225095 [Aspergillus parasiticus]
MGWRRSAGDWKRAHWKFKPYRVFFCQVFGVIAQTYGLGQALAWRKIVPFTLSRTHICCPTPKTPASSPAAAVIACRSGPAHFVTNVGGPHRDYFDPSLPLTLHATRSRSKLR